MSLSTHLLEAFQIGVTAFGGNSPASFCREGRSAGDAVRRELDLGTLQWTNIHVGVMDVKNGGLVEPELTVWLHKVCYAANY